MMPTDINSIVLNIHGVDYRCIINLLRNTDLTERSGSL